MRATLSRHLLGLGLASLAAIPSVALAQDSDGDGAANAADAFPCDPARASVSYFPGQSTSALLAFEDQWPNHTDVDYNDVVVRAHFRLERNAAGNVVALHAVIDPVALGGDLSNGLGLQLPASRTGVTARRRIAGGAWQAVALEADSNATMILSPNLRELFGNAAGRINSVGAQARLSGQRLELEVTFATPAAISQAAAPFDVFVFRSGNLGHQIHFPQYSGTAAMNAALFNSDQDRSTASRRFVHYTGVPAALNLMTSTRYPLEGVGISALFPDIVGFATSGGASNTAFYASNVVTAQGHDVAAAALPAVDAASSACVSGPIQVVSYSMTNGETGSFTYWDDAYTGSGSRGTSLSALSGGVGDLTDGVVATANWFTTPGPYVGWVSVVPDITFNFGGIEDVDSITLHVDDANGHGGVATPSAVEITVGGVTVTRTIVDPPGSEPLALTFGSLGLRGSSARVRLFDGIGSWVFVSEVSFRRAGADGGNVVRSGLALHYDAAVPASGSVGSPTWFDLSGNGLHGTLANGAAFDTTRGGAVRLDGVDDHVLVPGGFTSIFRSATRWTASLWVSVRQFNAGNDASPVLVSIGNNPPSNYYELFLETSAGTSWMATGGGVASTSLSTAVNTVYNFTWVLDGSTGYLFRNGALVATYPGMSTMSDVLGDLWLGRFKTGDYELDGHLYQVQLYHRALTAAEIGQNFQALRGRYGL